MKFTNGDGQNMNLADNLTLKELLDMGVSVSVSEDADPDMDVWLASPDENTNEQLRKPVNK